MKKTSLIRLAIWFIVLSIFLVSCSPNELTTENKLTAAKLIEVMDKYDTYAFNGQLTLQSVLPSYSLTTMRTLPFDHNAELKWKGKFRRGPLRIEADIELKTEIHNADMTVPLTLIITENDVFLASPVLTQDRYIHQPLEEISDVPLPTFLGELSKTALLHLSEISIAEATPTSLNYNLEKEMIDKLIQQLLFYELPNRLSDNDAQETILSTDKIGGHRVNYLDNKDAFFQMLSVVDAETRWQLKESEAALEQSWNISMMIDDRNNKGSITIQGSQLYSEPNSNIIFNHAIPTSDRLIPLKDMLSLVEMFGK